MKRFLALGDSYTIGEGVPAAERWPSQLVRTLRERGVSIADPELVAQTAWTTDELSDAIDGVNPRGPYDMVSLLIGVNDQYRSRPVAGFAAEFTALVARAIAFAGGAPGRLLVLSIPDWGATPFAAGRDRTLIAREIEEYNQAARAIAGAAGARWADVTESSRAMLAEPHLVTADGLHPTGEMYRRWAEAAVPQAIAILSR